MNESKSLFHELSQQQTILTKSFQEYQDILSKSLIESLLEPSCNVLRALEIDLSQFTSDKDPRIVLSAICILSVNKALATTSEYPYIGTSPMTKSSSHNCIICGTDFIPENSKGETEMNCGENNNDPESNVNCGYPNCGEIVKQDSCQPCKNSESKITATKALGCLATALGINIYNDIRALLIGEAMLTKKIAINVVGGVLKRYGTAIGITFTVVEFAVCLGVMYYN